MKCPTYLHKDKEAIAFFKRHWKQCYDNGSLTDLTISSFALVCKAYSIIVNTDPFKGGQEGMRFNGLLKHYQAMAKSFGLLNTKPPKQNTKSLQEVTANAIQSRTHQISSEEDEAPYDDDEGLRLETPEDA